MHEVYVANKHSHGKREREKEDEGRRWRKSRRHPQMQRLQDRIDPRPDGVRLPEVRDGRGIHRRQPVTAKIANNFWKISKKYSEKHSEKPSNKTPGTILLKSFLCNIKILKKIPTR